MKKTEKMEQLATVFPAVAAILAGRYDMPELTSVTPVPATKYRSDEVIPNTLRAELDITPRGQIASIVKSLNVRLEVSVSEDGRFFAGLNLSYSHVDGGSNGKDTRYVVITDTQYASEIEVVDVITNQAHYILERGYWERARANMKGKTPEELHAIFNKD